MCICNANELERIQRIILTSLERWYGRDFIRWMKETAQSYQSWNDCPCCSGYEADCSWEESERSAQWYEQNEAYEQNYLAWFSKRHGGQRSDAA